MLPDKKPVSLPKHVGIIPDGNRRWARKNKVDLFDAYVRGYNKLVEIVKHLNSYNINYISVYGLSYDNCIRRSESEKRVIEEIAIMALRDLRKDKDLESNDIRVMILGDPTIFSNKLAEEAEYTVSATKHRKNGLLTIGICYSGQWEVKNYCGKKNTLPSLELPSIDLIIRTGGMHRLSGFFPLLSEYAELYFLDKLWPEITRQDITNALEWFSRQPRNFGR